MLYLLLLIGLLAQGEYQSGPLSHYAPRDGWNEGTLSCGGQFDFRQNHIAHRRWKRLGCGRAVLVFAEKTGRFSLSRVWDSGPWGACKGKRAKARAEGRWMVWTKYKLPKGWRRPGLTDLSDFLWKKLGKPPFLSKVHLLFLPFYLKEGKLLL